MALHHQIRSATYGLLDYGFLREQLAILSSGWISHYRQLPSQGQRGNMGNRRLISSGLGCLPYSQISKTSTHLIVAAFC